jgi:hypothetical protein
MRDVQFFRTTICETIHSQDGDQIIQDNEDDFLESRRKHYTQAPTRSIEDYGNQT